MKILVEVADNKTDFTLEVFKNLTFIKKAKPILKNEITNSAILHSIDLYERGVLKPSKISLAKLKKMLHG